MVGKNYEIKVIKNLKLPYSYIPLKVDVDRYVKDYYYYKDIDINEDNIEEVKPLYNSMVLISNNKYTYWCPLFDEIYINSYRSNKHITLIQSLEIITKNYKSWLSFTLKGRTYKTQEIKRINIIKNEYKK